MALPVLRLVMIIRPNKEVSDGMADPLYTDKESLKAKHIHKRWRIVLQSSFK